MITDRETNFVYFSSLIKELEQYASFWKRLEKILSEKKISYGFIENTRDIWCRDYMPIQLDTNQFVQFNFFPDYCLLPQYISKLTIPSEVRTYDKINLRPIDLVIDGGNFVKSTSDVILTDKVLKENPKLSKDIITTMLKKELNLDNIYLIPQQPYDMTGHADGMVRFINNTDLLVADYSNESKSWRIKMDKALDKTGLNIIPYPTKITNERNKEGDYTAKGTYINFLQLEDYILLPQFGFDLDNVTFIRTKELFPDFKVIPINCNEIATNGGILNCISWNIKTQTKTSFHNLSHKRPDRSEQQKFIFDRIGFYLSTYDYQLIAKRFEIVWNNSTGQILGDGDIKNKIYRFLEQQQVHQNPIPQYHVDKTIDLILDYMEYIGQYGFPFHKN